MAWVSVPSEAHKKAITHPHLINGVQPSPAIESRNETWRKRPLPRCRLYGLLWRRQKPELNCKNKKASPNSPLPFAVQHRSRHPWLLNMSTKWYTSDSRAEPENEPVPSFPPKRTPVSPESVIWAAAGCSGCHSTHHKRKVPMNENISICLAFKDHYSVNPSFRLFPSGQRTPHTLHLPVPVTYITLLADPRQAMLPMKYAVQHNLFWLFWKLESARNYIMAGIWHDGKADCKREGFSRDIYICIFVTQLCRPSCNTLSG